MNTSSQDQKEKLLLQQLKDILLKADREKIQQLQEILDSYDLLSGRVSPIIEDHLTQLKKNYPDEFRFIVTNLIEKRAKKIDKEVFLINSLLNDKDHLSDKVSPIVEDHIDFIKQNFPEEFTAIINKQIEQKIKDSQEEILNVITPVLGKLIRKSITHQFQILKESIDKRVRSTFSKRGFFGRIFGFNKKEEKVDVDIIISEADPAIIEEIYVIQRDSGLLLGSAPEEESLDQDVIAGMFTAIKAFVEDAFKIEHEELAMIEYDNYKIYIQNFHSYYIAVAISGSVSAAEKDTISEKLYDFAEKELKLIPKSIDDSVTNRVSAELNNYFFNPVEPLKLNTPDD